MIRPLGSALVLLALLVGTARAHEGLHRRIAAVEAKIRAAPEDVPPRVEHARLLREGGHAEQAAAALDGLAEIAPGHPLLLLERGLLALETGDDPAPWLDAHLASPDPRAVGFDARAALHAGAGRPWAALSDRQDAWQRGPTPDRALAFAAALEHVGDHPCAAQALADAERQLAGAIVVRLERVEVLLRGRMDARAAARALVDDAPDNPDRWLLLARATEPTDPEQAHGLRERALQLATQRLADRPSAVREAALARARASLEAP